MLILPVQHLPFLLVEFHLRVGEGVLKGDSPVQEFVVLFNKALLPFWKYRSIVGAQGFFVLVLSHNNVC